MHGLALSWMVGMAVGAQFGGASQIGAQYVGIRPVLNAQSCRGNNGVVNVQYDMLVNTTTGVGGIPTIPFGVIYTHDADIPVSSPTVGGTGSTGGVNQQLYTSPVTCGEPVSENILLDNIPLAAGAQSRTLVELGVSITVSNLLEELCNTDGGVRKRRAVCFGIRNGQGAATVARAGDGPDIDTDPPGAPTALSSQAGDAFLQITVTPPAGTSASERAGLRYYLEYRRCTPDEAGDAGAASASSSGASSSTSAGIDGGVGDAGGLDGGALDDAGALDAAVGDAADAALPETFGACGPYILASGGAQLSPANLTGLENGVSYQVRARAVDEAGNEGPVSTATTFGTPIKQYGFLDLYGQPIYGANCQQGGGPFLLAGLGLLVAGFARRRARSTDKRSR